MNRLLALCLFVAAGIALADEAAPPPTRHVVIEQPSPAERPTTALLGLRSMTWEEAEPMIRPMLTENGTLGYLGSRNAIIVRDQQQVVDQVREFVEAADRDAVNIRVKVEFVGDTLRTHGKLGVVFTTGWYHGVAGSGLDRGRLNTVDTMGVSIENRSTTETRDNTMQLLTRSGSAARLWVGQTIPDPAWLRQYKYIPFAFAVTRRGTVVATPVVPPVEWRNEGSALYVRATYQENDLVHLELFPVLTFIDGEGHERHLQVQEVRTEVYAKPGQRVYLGGTDEAWTRFTRELFGPSVVHRDEKSGSVSMYVTPYITMMRSPTQ